MSLNFNDTSNFRGLVQIYEKEIGKERGFVSGNTNRMKEFAAAVNLAWDDYVALAIKASGDWQFDDSNQTDYPIIKTDIVSGQRDYTFVTDESGNLILDIYKVALKQNPTTTIYTDIYPIDVQSEPYLVEEFNDTNLTGVPQWYDKTANGITFRTIPNYNATEGLLVYINREPSYFTSTDTTKKPGCPGVHHRYFALKPALDYARQNQLSNYNLIREEVVSFEGDEEKGITGSITKYFSKRERDVKDVLRPEPIIYE